MVAATVLQDKELKNFPVPTLVLIGKNEKVYSAPKAIERLRQVAPQIKAEMISDAGHDLWYVHADVVTRKILEFLANTEKMGN
jgi:pimeloyl-ACP methyl ester carboxylesterase